MSQIRLLVATPDRDLLVSLLIFLREAAELSVVGTASDFASFMALTRSTRADVLLIDESLMAAESNAIVAMLEQVVPRPSLVLLAAEEGDSPVQQVADAVVFTHDSPQSLIKSLTQVIESKRHHG